MTVLYTLPRAAAVLAFALSFIASAAFAQGPIVPTGTPTPTMKTLDQVEARKPIPGGTTTVNLTADGSYYLTGNIAVTASSGITVSANSATIDLNGFSINSNAPNGDGFGVYCTGAGSFVVRNGQIRGSTTVNTSTGAFTANGFQAGVFFENGVTSARVENLEVNGVTTYGIAVPSTATALIARCQMNITGYNGIYAPAATVENCTVQNCGNVGITAAVVRGCVATSYTANGISASRVAENSDGDALSATSQNVYGLFTKSALNCHGHSVAGIGVFATTATNCTAETTGTGIGLAATTATDCVATSTSGAAVRAYSANNCRGTSTSGDAVYGIGAAVNCTGDTSTGIGVHAGAATNCRGSASNTGTGIDAVSATGCYGDTLSGTGIRAYVANGCYGNANGISSSAYAIDCGTFGVAVNCYATTNSVQAFTLRAKTANGCVLTTGQSSITHNINTF